MKGGDFSSHVTKLFDQMKPVLTKTTGAGLLKDYSPWLAAFQANHYSEHIEIPGVLVYVCIIIEMKEVGEKLNDLCGICAHSVGQYDGLSKPLPEYHVKISSFDEKVC